MPEKFDPTRPIHLSGAVHTELPRAPSERDPTVAFTTVINPDLVMPEHVPAQGMSAANSPDAQPPRIAGDASSEQIDASGSESFSRRKFIYRSCVAVGALVGAIAGVAVAPTVKEQLDKWGEKLDGAEVWAQTTEMASKILAAGRGYFAEQLPTRAYPFKDSDQAGPYQLQRDAASGNFALSGIFGYIPYWDAESGIALSVGTPQEPTCDSLPRTNLTVFFKDESPSAVVRGKVQQREATFDNLMSWTQAATVPTDRTKPQNPHDPNNALMLSRIGVLVVDKGDCINSKQYWISIDTDGILVLRPGYSNREYDQFGNLNEEWLSPGHAGYADAFMQTIAALGKGLQDFSERAKTAR